MAPVIQTTPKDRNDRSKRIGDRDRKSDLVCRVKYCNGLPDIPFDPKFITYPFETNRFVQYKPTSLEKNYKHDLLTEHDLGVTIDLINPETYIPPADSTKLADEDEKLLEEEVATPQDSKRSRCHNKAITWLKKTEYISTEFNRYGASSDKTETKVGYNVKKKMKEEALYLDRESQIIAINKTFEAAKKAVKEHPGKPGITPLEVLPIFPDFKLWKYPFAQVMFDADPAPITQVEEMSQAMIRGVMDESGEQFVAYFLPTEDTINKRKFDELESVEYREAEEYEYVMAREYNWNVKNKATKGYEENYFFILRDDQSAICYNELETRVRLSKRRIKQGSAPSNSKLIVKHRPLNESEFKTQEIRMTQLEPPQEEEEQPPEQISKETENANNDVENNEKANDSDAEVNTKPKVKTEPKSSASEKSSSSESSASSSSSESSESSSSSDSDSDEDEVRKKTKQDAAAIFGSGSDSD